MAVLRVLVTASRTWEDKDVIRRELSNTWKVLPEGDELVVIHGDCESGGDRVAKLWTQLMSGNAGAMVREEPHAADWRMYDRAAGPIRNSEMVDLGADICLAFIHNRSKGATDCAKKAKKAGIPTELFPSGTTPTDWLDDTGD